MRLRTTGSTAVLEDRTALRNFSQRVEKAKPPMELRYMRDVADDRGPRLGVHGEGAVVAGHRRVDAAGVVIGRIGQSED